MTKNISIAVAVIVILFLGIWYWRFASPVSAPTTKGTSVTAEEINKDLQNIDIGNLDKDFEAVNANINTL